MSSRQPSKGFRLVYGLVKLVAIVGGLALTVVCLMSAVGALSDNGWLRFLAALLVAVLVPLVLIERILPDGPLSQSRGIPTDTAAVFLVLVPFLYAGPGLSVTRPLLVREGDRLHKAGWPQTARLAYWMGRVQRKNRIIAPRKAATSRPVPPATRRAVLRPKVRQRPVAREKSDGGTIREAPPRPKVAKKLRRRPPPRRRKRRRREEKSPAVLFKECAPSVVTIRVNRGGGTGFLLDKWGTLATNHHVIKGATFVRVKLHDGTWIDEVELLTQNAKLDLALLRIHTNKRLRPLRLGDSSKVVVGQRVISIGNPLGLEHTLTDGLVSARRIWRGRKMIQMSVPVSPGNSGGPLLNLRGEVLGVTTAQLTTGFFNRAQNLNLAVPINMLKKMIRPKYPKRRRIGKKRIRTGTW